MSDHDTLGIRISQARELKGLNIDQVARKAGVTVETFRDWENDRNEPRPNRMQILAGVLGVSISWLLTGDADHGPQEDRVDRLERLEHKVERMAHLQAELGRLSAEIADEVSEIREESDEDSELAA